MKRICCLLIIAFIFIFLTGISAPKKSLVLGGTPWGQKEDMIANYTPFVDYLSESLDMKVSLSIALDYKSLANDLNDGVVDIGILSPGAFVEALDEYPKIQYLCTEIDSKTGKDSYESFIIVKKNGPIRNYKDLKGKLFAFVDEKSSSGYKFPLWLMLTKWKIKPDDFFQKTLFVGNHNTVMKAVYEGQADAGAVASDIFKRSKTADQDNDKLFTIIDKVSDLPNGGIALSPKIDKVTATKLAKILTALNPKTTTRDGRLVTEKFQRSGFTRRNAHFYDILRQAGKAAEDYRKKRDKKTD